jgi:hypothetical protein
VLLVIGFSALLQQLESNLLLPRIMSRTVGLSALVGLFAVLAFGELYGALGVIVAIPLTVVVQVLVDHMVINPEPTPETYTVTADPLAALLARGQALRQRARLRLRDRESRMVEEPHTTEDAADSFDQCVEQAVERLDTMIKTTQEDTTSITPTERETLVVELQHALQKIEQAVAQIDKLLPLEPQGEQMAGKPGQGTPAMAELQRATRRVAQALRQAEVVLTEAQENDDKLHDNVPGATPPV